MARYASLDEEGYVNGFYDTDAISYPSLPEVVVELDPEDWAIRLQHRIWVIVNGRLSPVEDE